MKVETKGDAKGDCQEKSEDEGMREGKGVEDVTIPDASSWCRHDR